MTPGGTNPQNSSGTWTISGIADLAPGADIIRVNVADDDGGTGSVDVTIDVAQEIADVEFDSGNPVAV